MNNTQNEDRIGVLRSIVVIVRAGIGAIRAAFTRSMAAHANYQQSSNNQEKSDIYLKIGDFDCFEELFDYLSFREVIAMSKTCKDLQRITSYCFQQNYSAIRRICHRNRIYIHDYLSSPDDTMLEINHLSQFIQKISLLGESSFEDFPSFQPKLLRLRQIQFKVGKITKIQMKRLKKMLNKIDTLQISHCQIDGKFHEIVLTFCPNLKRLSLEERTRTSVIIGTNNDWFCRQYPTLERFDLLHYCDHRRLEEVLKVDELKTFLELNPNVRTFTIVADSLWWNRDSMIISKIKLDVLIVSIGEALDLKTFYGFLNELEERGFYKRLHLHFSNRRSQEDIDKLDMLKALKKLNISSASYRVSLSAMNKLRELCIGNSQQITDLEQLPSNHLQLEVIDFSFATIDDILKLVRWAPNLNKIKVRCFKDGSQFKVTDKILDLKMLNGNREKLRQEYETDFSVPMVMIYVSEAIFLATKWAFKGIEFSLIRLRRIESHESDTVWV